MQEPHREPQHNTAHTTLKQAQNLLLSLSMPSLSAIPDNAQSRLIEGDHNSIEYFFEPSPGQDKLLWATVQVPEPFSPSYSILTLSPFPQGEAAERILHLLRRTDLTGVKADQILPELEALGKEATGAGWKPVLDLPLPNRLDLPPLTYIAPALEKILTKDQGYEHTFAASRNTNGTYELCTATLHPQRESVSFSFYRSENDAELQPVGHLDLPTTQVARGKPQAQGGSIQEQLYGIAAQGQAIFRCAGAEYAMARMEQVMVKGYYQMPFPPGLSQDERMRLMTAVRPPYEFAHAFASGAIMAIESGTEVVSLMVKASPLAHSSAYISTLDRAQLTLSDSEWEKRRSDFIATAKRLANESEGLQPEALADVLSLSTKRARIPTPVSNLVNEKAMSVLGLLTKQCALMVRTDLGNSPSEIRRICDGSEILVVSHATKKLGTENLAVFHELTLELKPNGAIDFTAHNLLGNQITGRISAAGVKAAGGPSEVVLSLATIFTKQFTEQTPFFLHEMLEAAAALDSADSFVFADGQAPYADLPEAQDRATRSIFTFAELFAQYMCLFADGYGKHHVGVIGPQTVEVRFQFPRAPYNLSLKISDKGIVQANFIPNDPIGNPAAPQYSFAGELAPPALDFNDLQALLRSFGEWGRDHSQKKANVQPLEELPAFKTLKKMLPDDLSDH
jgi:hypothetical protein